MTSLSESHHDWAAGIGQGRKRLRGEVLKLVDAWLLWTTLGALGGVLMLSPTLQSRNVMPPPAPSATEIEHAIAQAEIEGIKAGAPIKPGRSYR